MHLTALFHPIAAFAAPPVIRIAIVTAATLWLAACGSTSTVIGSTRCGIDPACQPPAGNQSR